MPSVEPVIRFENVSKTFQRPDGRGEFVAVDKLSFEIDKGEIVAVLGKTGCGKSTMFNIVAGLIEPSCGKATSVGSRPVSRIRFFSRQDRHRFPERPPDALAHARSTTCWLGLQILDADPKQAEDTARAWLTRLGLCRPRK